MLFDPENPINKLCAQGMGDEAQGRHEDAAKLFIQAWNEANNDIEKFTAAHYVARHQKTLADKLNWDEVSLDYALRINNDEVKSTYPSLYLNIAKGYEDLGDFEMALKKYELAHSYSESLADDGYGKLIKSGIINGIKRVKGS